MLGADEAALTCRREVKGFFESGVRARRQRERFHVPTHHLESGVRARRQQRSLPSLLMK